MIALLPILADLLLAGGLLGMGYSVITGYFPFPGAGISERTWEVPSCFLLTGLAILLVRGRADSHPPGNSPGPLATRLLRLSRWLQQDRRHWGPVLAVTALFALVLGILSHYLDYGFKSSVWDVGVWEQQLWYILETGQPYTSAMFTHGFGDHFSPFLYLLAPLYHLWPCSLGLMLIGVAALSASLPVFYLLAQELSGDRLPRPWLWGALLAYACYLPLRRLAVFPFHPEVFTPLLFFGVCLCWLRRRPGYAALLLALLVSIRETNLLFVFSCGLFLALGERRRRLGFLLMLASVLLLALLLLVVIPWYQGVNPHYVYFSRYDWLGSAPGEILRNLLRRPHRVLAFMLQPAKLQYLSDLLLPLAFLPLLAPRFLLPALPPLALHLASNYGPQSSVNYQYATDIYPWLCLGALAGLQRLLSWYRVPAAPETHGITGSPPPVFPAPPPTAPRPRLPLPLLSLLFLSCILFTTGPLPLWYRTAFPPNARTEACHRVIARIPDAGSVMTFDQAIPHVCRRRAFYQLTNAPGPADWVLFDIYRIPFPFTNWLEYRAYLRTFLDSPDYRMAAAEEGIWLLRHAPGQGPSRDYLRQLPSFFEFRPL